MQAHDGRHQRLLEPRTGSKTSTHITKKSLSKILIPLSVLFDKELEIWYTFGTIAQKNPKGGKVSDER